MKLKVCGMKYPENIKEVASLKPDYMGFIFWEPSKRYFQGNIPEIPLEIKKVGVFVDASLEDVLEKMITYDLQAVQLHGKETPIYCQELYHRLNVISNDREKLLGSIGKDGKVQIIKVFSIKNKFDFGVLDPYEDVCDYFLFDTKGKLPGGNGYRFDWKLLENYPSQKPYFLSGGIGLDETESVLSFLSRQASKYCHAIDVNSKFEIEPGLKNIGKLKEFKKTIITTITDSHLRGNDNTGLP